MKAGESGRDAPLDRVAGALSTESARTELYRYATTVAESLPPDSTGWYIVGAVMQVNAVTRRELASLASEAKKGGTALAGLVRIAEWLPGARTIAMATAVVTIIVALGIAGGTWVFAYNTGYGESRVDGYVPVRQEVCGELERVRHDLRTRRSDVQALDRERVRFGC